MPNLKYCITTDSEAAQLLLLIVYDVYYANLADIAETDVKLYSETVAWQCQAMQYTIYSLQTIQYSSCLYNDVVSVACCVKTLRAHTQDLFEKGMVRFVSLTLESKQAATYGTPLRLHVWGEAPISHALKPRSTKFDFSAFSASLSCSVKVSVW